AGCGGRARVDEGLVGGKRSPRGRAMPWDIEQDSASDDPAPGDDLDAETVAPGIVDLRGRGVVVEAVTRVGDVAEPVPLARPLEGESIEVVVATPGAPHLGTDGGLPERRRGGPLDRPVERETPAVHHERGARAHPLRGDEVERAELVVGAEEAPARSRGRVRSRTQLGVARQSVGRHGRPYSTATTGRTSGRNRQRATPPSSVAS